MEAVLRSGLHCQGVLVVSNLIGKLTALLACAERYRILGIALVAPLLKFTIEFRHSRYH